MFIVKASTLAGDLFRVSYQSVDAIYQNQVQLLPPQTISERIAETFKHHTALLDSCLTLGQYAFGLEGLNAWVAPLRIAAIAHGVYQLVSDPNANSKFITREIFLNLLNVSQVAIARFSRNATSPANQNFIVGATLACVVGDTAIRMGTLYVNRTSLISNIKNIYDQGLSQNYVKAEHIYNSGTDYITRTILATLFIFITFDIANSLLQEMAKENSVPSMKINEIIGWTTMAGAVSYLVAEAVHKIFDHMGLQATKKRRFVELLLSTLVTAPLMAIAAVRTGCATSVPEIFKPIYQSALTVTIAYTLCYVFKAATRQYLNSQGVPPLLSRDFEMRFSILSSLTLTALILKGSGITNTISESGLVMSNIFYVGFGSFFTYHCFVKGRTFLFLGTPSWNELEDWILDLI